MWLRQIWRRIFPQNPDSYDSADVRNASAVSDETVYCCFQYRGSAAPDDRRRTEQCIGYPGTFKVPLCISDVPSAVCDGAGMYDERGNDYRSCALYEGGSAQ